MESRKINHIFYIDMHLVNLYGKYWYCKSTVRPIECLGCVLNKDAVGQKQMQWAFILGMYHFLDSFQIECVLNKSKNKILPLGNHHHYFGFRASKFGGV